MAWLLRDENVLASLEIAGSFHARFRGLMGRKSFEGALLIVPAKSVHTFFMRFPIDVVFLDKDQHVVGVTSMRPWRLGIPRLKAHAVVEAPAGAVSRWNIAVGDELEIRE